MWPPISKCCGLGGKLLQYILLLVSSQVLFVPASVLLVFQEKYVRFTSGSECNGSNYLDPKSELHFSKRKTKILGGLLTYFSC